MKKLVLLTVLLIVTTSVVYASGWTTPKVWGQCVESVDRMPWYDAASKTLYFIRDYNIFQSNYDGNNWSKPEAVSLPGFNTRQNQTNPVKRGSNLYFASYSSQSDYDIYMASWNQDENSWSTPVVIKEVSSDGQDWGLWVSKDEKLMYLISTGSFAGKSIRGGRGVWKSVKKNDSWSTPVPLTGDINSEGNEWSVFKDEASGKIYIDSNRPGSAGGYDIWVMGSEDAQAVNLGSPINTSLNERSLWTDGSVIFFSGLNYDGGIGGYDIFVSFYEK